MDSLPPCGDDNANANACPPEAIARELVSMLETMPDGWLACDAEWRIVALNDPAASILGVRRDEVLGARYWEVFPATLETRLEREYRCVASGECRDFE